MRRSSLRESAQIPAAAVSWTANAFAPVAPNHGYRLAKSLSAIGPTNRLRRGLASLPYMQTLSAVVLCVGLVGLIYPTRFALAEALPAKSPSVADEKPRDSVPKPNGEAQPANGEAQPAAAESAAGMAKQIPLTTGNDSVSTGGSARRANPVDAGDDRLRLRRIEQRVNELKERVFRSKARLNLLKETVLHGVIAGSRALIKHKNEMGKTFKLVKLVYSIDGKRIYAKTQSDGTLSDKRDLEIFNGSIVPGNHTISALMVFQGSGYGVFTYLKGYKFTVRASHTFTAGEGRQNAIVVKAYEKGNAMTELRDRPAIKFDTNVYKVTGKTNVASKSAPDREKAK